MATITIPDSSASVGFPAQGADDLSAVDVALITGSEPAILQTDQTVAASQVIPAYSPVMFSGADLVLAVQGTVAVGITIIDITTPASGSLKGVQVYRAGCFNPAKIVWPASYDTEAKKMAAFAGAPTPTNIILRKIKSATVV